MIAEALLALTVTRHVDNQGAVCLSVTGIKPTATSIVFRSGPSYGANSFPAGTESVCLPMFVPHEGSPLYEVRQCDPVPYNPATSIYTDCEVTEYQESLCCDAAAVDGCRPDIYHVCQGSEP